MHRHLVGLPVTIVFWVAAAPVAQASQLEVLRYFSLATVQPLVDYCHAQAPDRSESVQRGLENYVMRLDDALRGRKLSAGIPEQLTPELRAEAQAAGARLVQSIRHIDAGTYCGWLASRLQLATREMLVESLDQFDRQMEGQSAPAPKAGR
jgi:hypothetical protein